MILRIHYKKIGNMKFLSHLDMVRLMERGLRRAGVPLKFSQGFNPHPRIAFAAPLSVGVSSEYELVDIELTEAIDLSAFQEAFSTYFPSGIQMVRGRLLEKSQSLMSLITDCSYAVTVHVAEGQGDLFAKTVGILMDQEEILAQKKGKDKKIKTVDVRPLLKHVEVVDVNGDVLTLAMKVETSSKGSLKPEMLLTFVEEKSGVAVLSDLTRVHRVKLYGDEGKTELYVIE